MDCRPGCAACCIAPSISQAYANMPAGKAAGQPCVNLDSRDGFCKIWGQASYPSFCHNFQAEPEFCGENRDQALQILSFLEEETRS